MAIYLIDGYNVLHHLLGRQSHKGGKPDLDEPFRLEHERERLVDAITSFMAGTSDRAIIVFDSRGSRLQKVETAIANVQVYFGSFMRSADAIIEREAHTRAPGEEVIVVTSDYALQIAAFVSNVVRLPSRLFVEELQRHTKKVANSQKCITMSHRVEDRIDRATLDKLKALRDELLKDEDERLGRKRG